MNSEQLWELGRRALLEAQSLGAEEAAVAVSRNSDVSLIRRAGRLEQSSQATSLSLSISMLVGDRYSGHATSDLRPEALKSFLEKAVAATRALEPEPERRQAPVELCGIGADAKTLDQKDASWESYTIEDKRRWAVELEEAVEALPGREQLLSASCYHSDSGGQTVKIFSNGFEGESQHTGYGQGVEMTLSEPGGRRPEAMSWFSANYRSDLPGPEVVARQARERANRRLGSHSIASGRYPMLLEAHATGRVLGTLAGPLSGAELHQGRSFFAGKKGQAIASSALTLTDDPLVPRGAGSRPFDGDGLKAKVMPVIEDGVLQNYYINLYYSRKLGVEPTTGGRSNWVVRPGKRSPEEILKDLPKCIVVTGFLGGNSNGLTGDFSFGIQGLLMEHGEVTAHLSEMNVSGNLGDIFHRLVEPASDVWHWSSCRSPSLLFDGVDFSGM